MIRFAPLAVVFALAALARADSAAPPTDAAIEKEALALVASWVDAQNRGDFAAYAALYDAAHFKGVKRTARGGVTTYDFAGWSTDRKKMFDRKPKVEAVAPSVRSWLDAKSKLKPGVVAVHFVQRWRTERYADHGEKLLHLLRGASGKLGIVYEDLLHSEPGWDARAGVVAKLVLAPPKDDAAAGEVWTKIAPTAGTLAEKLEAIPAQPGVTRPLARALLAQGNFECKKVVEVSECGDDSVSWAELDPKAGLDDPCLRRRLADWTLTKGGLTEADLAALGDAPLPLLGLPPPEDELPGHLLDLVDGMSTRTRLAYLHAAPPALAEQHTGGLPEPAAAELYEKDHLNAAALALDPKRHRALFFAALADDKLTVATRRSLLKTAAGLRGDDAERAVAGVADDAADCGLAMEAALASAARGDRTHLPHRTDGSDAELARALCMLVHDPDPARRLARYREFLPPRGRVTINEELHDEFAERDEQGRRTDPPIPDEHFTRKDAERYPIEAELGAGDAPTCDGDACKVGTSDGWYGVVFAAGKDGHTYLSQIRRYRWRGCPC